jgi:hypothetical protein
VACRLKLFNPIAFPVFSEKMGMVRDDIDVFVIGKQLQAIIKILAAAEIDIQRGPLTGKCFLLIRV